MSKQYRALLATEGVEIDFTDDGLVRIATIAYNVNERSENIGARRLHTVMEKLLEALSFTASDMAGQRLMIDADYVDRHIGELAEDDDLGRYIL